MMRELLFALLAAPTFMVSALYKVSDLFVARNGTLRNSSRLSCPSPLPLLIHWPAFGLPFTPR